MRKTKIVCTIGPACGNKETLKEMTLSDYMHGGLIGKMRRDKKNRQVSEPAGTTVSAPKQETAGDANGDGIIDMADAVLIMQSLANPDKYMIAAENALNADVSGRGNGITTSDALAIQKYLLGLIKALPES